MLQTMSAIKSLHKTLRLAISIVISVADVVRASEVVETDSVAGDFVAAEIVDLDDVRMASAAAFAPAFDVDGCLAGGCEGCACGGEEEGEADHGC